MIKNKVMIALLLAMLAGITLIPSVSASENNEINAEVNMDDALTTEEKIISSIPSNQNSVENITKAKELLEKVKAQNLQEISDSVNKSTSGTQIKSATTVTLGTDKTLTTADIGNSGTSTSGAVPNFKDADYSTSYRRARASVLIGPGGYGTGGAWAWVGKSIYVSGSGSRSANIRMAGNIKGETSAFAGGQSNTDINLIVKDTTTGTSYTTSIYSQSAGGVGDYIVDESFNDGISVTLQAGHYYNIYVSVDGSTAVYYAGEAGSDFGPGDGDDGGQKVSYSSIVIDF